MIAAVLESDDHQRLYMGLSLLVSFVPGRTSSAKVIDSSTSR